MLLLEENEMNVSIAVGPWGGPGGSSWDDFPNSSVKKIVIVHAVGIDSIQIEYDVNGTSVWSPKHGGRGGEKTDKVVLDSPNEYLIEMHGHYGQMDRSGPVFIRSLSFESNKKKYGPYGREEGTYFSIPTLGALIAGFHGTSCRYLDSIGIYLRPIRDPKNLNNNTVLMEGDKMTKETLIQRALTEQKKVQQEVQKKWQEMQKKWQEIQKWQKFAKTVVDLERPKREEEDPFC